MAVREVTPELMLPPPGEAHHGPDPEELRLQIIAVMHGLAAILAARLILLVGSLVAAGLTAYAMYLHSNSAVVASGIFDALVVVPSIWLALKKG